MFKRAKNVIIPHHQLDSGIEHIRWNIFEFVKDARILLKETDDKEQRTIHVSGLLELAIQELGKAVLLREKSQELLKQSMDESRAGKILTVKTAEIKGFYDHGEKHKRGIRLLPKEVRKVPEQVLAPLSKEGVAYTEVHVDEGLRLRDFYIDWDPQKGWRLPPSWPQFVDRPPVETIATLTKLADAIETAAKNFKNR